MTRDATRSDRRHGAERARAPLERAVIAAAVRVAAARTQWCGRRPGDDEVDLWASLATFEDELVVACRALRTESAARASERALAWQRKKRRRSP